MSQQNRVVWSEGLFLRPQHFQQAERFLEYWIESRIGAGFAYGYGFSSLELDPELLKLGKLGIRSARGIMPDGTPFAIPDECPAPPPLEVPTDCKDTVALLALPLRRSGMPELSLGDAAGLPRYRGVDALVSDNVAGIPGEADMKVGQLAFKLVLANSSTEAYTTMSVAKISERRSSNVVVLTENHIPPCLDCRASETLHDYLRDIASLINHRANGLAGRLGQPGQQGVAEIVDFLMLQVANRFDPIFRHLQEREPLHPESLYMVCLGLAGELATFTHANRRPADLPAYRHDALLETYLPLINDLRDSLTAVMDQNALSIELQDRGRGLYTASIPDLDLLRSASFILAVNAQVAGELLRHDFPTQVKVGPAEKIRDLVMSHLPGIVLQPLPVAPRQLPYHAGFTYFELDRGSEFWKTLEANRLLALHIAGDFPGLQMELWGIRS
ncbi:type VI secretion system baseplate subunit TssK [Parasulfuritortus cantonensis]|uniref:Type VI secretion system baseplate subunit TssK n=1 Tax=Parasulfuritortus cantonensis TaxID=2528202 RepID=A0A4R1BRJ0_9PROT|nr:type VI secretion system baseplate subunit TssK [Parasulfuritortus cantonensis]TCJ20393.1 type VI secretion system baseplate subunit TssK [Parasulfuritortus cantonensis]